MSCAVVRSIADRRSVLQSSAGTETFCGRFSAFAAKWHWSADDVRDGVLVQRCYAIKVLLGVPWKLIPHKVCDRHPIVGLHTLLLLCRSLDEVGVSPGNVNADQLYLAWEAAGHERFLRRRTAAEVYKRLMLRGLARDPEILGGLLSELARRAGYDTGTSAETGREAKRRMRELQATASAAAKAVTASATAPAIADEQHGAPRSP